MPESTPTEPTPPAQETPPQTPPAAPEPDWKAEARKWEQRAKENKTAADKLAELEAANKSEIEKANDRATKAEAEVASLPAKVAEALRTHLVALGVVDKDDEVLLTAGDPDALLAQVKRLGERTTNRRKNGNHVPREGTTTPPAGSDEMREFTRNLFEKATQP